VKANLYIMVKLGVISNPDGVHRGSCGQAGIAGDIIGHWAGAPQGAEESPPL